LHLSSPCPSVLDLVTKASRHPEREPLITHLSTIMSRKVGILAGIVYAQDSAWDPEEHDVGDGYHP
jgi:hypothetical protein